MMNPGGAARAAKMQREAILSATPMQLTLMLYRRTMLDMHRAKTAMEASDWPAMNQHLVHAQEIIQELANTLDDSQWSGARELRAIYTYAQNALSNANIGRDVAKVSEAQRLLEPLEKAWQEAAHQPLQSAGRGGILVG